MSDSNVLPLFKIAGMHSSLKSVNYCFKRTVFENRSANESIKLLKSLCARSCVSLKGHVWTFKYFPAARCVVRVTFLLLPPVVVPTPERHKFGEFGLPDHLNLSPVPCQAAGCPTAWLPCLPGDPVLLVWAEASAHQSHWLASCPPLLGLKAGSKEDWESSPVISSLRFAMELFGQL